MKKRIVSGMLFLSLLLGLLAVSGNASVDLENGDCLYDPVKIQFLSEPILENCTPQCYYDDLVYFLHSELGGYGIVDVYGNCLLEPIHDSYNYLGEGYASFRQENGRQALFYRDRQLTSYRFSDIQKMACCFKAELPNGNYEFLDANGRTYQIPTVAEKNWSAIDIIPNKAIVLCRAEDWYYDSYLGGYVNISARYQVVDWKGNPITQGTTDCNIQIEDENTFLVSGGSRYDRIHLDGSVEKKRPYGYLGLGGEAYDTQYHILYKDEGSVREYYLYDTDYNQICKLDTTNERLTPVTIVSNKLFIVRRPDTTYVLMNARGEEITELPGNNCVYIGCVEKKGEAMPNMGFAVVDEQNSYLYDMEGKQTAVLEGVTEVESYGYYISAKVGDYQYRLYDLDGNLLFDYDAYETIEIVNGVILKMNLQRTAYAVLGKDGKKLTDYIFMHCQTTRNYGLMRAKIEDEEGYYLVNAEGEVLNPIGFDEPTYNIGRINAYSVDGKMGFFRVLNPGDGIFMDVPNGTWYYEATEYCAENGLFAGTAVGKFSPDDAMTRAMLVSVLWRLDGKPTPKGTASFADVQSGAWYADAVCWAAENEIVFGVGDGKFAPDDNITREQIAAIMLRYAKKKGYDTQEKTDISSFADSSRVSSYAVEAIQWANAAGILSGSKEGSQVLLLPQNNATRAQLASILMRFVKNIA